MEIDLGQDITFNVRYNGETYELKEPTVGAVEKFEKAFNKKDSSKQRALIDFVSSLGMPSDVASAMGVTKLNRLAQGLTLGLEEEKKS